MRTCEYVLGGLKIYVSEGKGERVKETECVEQERNQSKRFNRQTVGINPLQPQTPKAKPQTCGTNQQLKIISPQSFLFLSVCI